MKPFVPTRRPRCGCTAARKKIRVKTLTFKPVNGGAAGVATLKVKSGKAGRLSLRASHRATPALATAVAKRAWMRSSPTPPAAHAARPCASCRPSSRR